MVKRLCPNVAVMYQGRIVEMGPCRALLSDPLHPYTQRLLAAAVSYQAKDIYCDDGLLSKMQLREKQKGHFVLE